MADTKDNKVMGNEQAPKASAEPAKAAGADKPAREAVEMPARDRATEDGYYLSNPAANRSMEPGTRPAKDVMAEKEAEAEAKKGEKLPTAADFSPNEPMDPYVPVEDETNQPAEGVNPTPFEDSPGEMRKGLNLGENSAEKLGQYNRLV